MSPTPHHDPDQDPRHPDDLALDHRRLVSRRRFLLGTGVLGAAGLTATGVRALGPLLGSDAPTTVSSSLRRASVSAPSPAHPILILVTLYGGNDGLNTLIPYTDSAYHAGRPHLGYQPDQVIKLDAQAALNPKLTGFKTLWDAKHLAIVQGVGYPNPSLSHFQSMDIWQTANPDAVGSGWLGRWLDATGTDPMRAVSVGATLPPALVGTKTAAAAITSTTITLPGSAAFGTAYGLLGGSAPDRTGLAGVVGATDADLLAVRLDLDTLMHVPRSPSAADPVLAATPTATTSHGVTLGDQLEIVASLIKAGASTRVYQVSLESFDTHADEKTAHESLLGELDQAVTSFFTSLEATPAGGGVVLMTYSEFGRRVAENASGGTDHGTASPLFVVGPSVKGGRLYGEQPSLTDLDDGDLKFNVDFRSVYATMLDRVVGVDPWSFLGASYPTLDLV